MVEIMSKDEQKRVHFNDTYHLLKKPRNPTTGELTSREDAEYLVPLSSIAEKTSAPASTAQEAICATETKLRGLTMFNKLIREMARCESLRQRREHIHAETAMVESIMQHKQVCASAGFTGPIHKKGEIVTKTAAQLAQGTRPF